MVNGRCILFLSLGGFDGSWFYPAFEASGLLFLGYLTLFQVYRYLDFPPMGSHLEDWQILDDLAAHDQIHYYIPHCVGN